MKLLNLIISVMINQNQSLINHLIKLFDILKKIHFNLFLKISTIY